MHFPEFKLETYLSRREFSAAYLLCCSDAETWTLSELLKLASPELQQRWEALPLGYDIPSGNATLRETIAQLYPGLGPENILCFAGAEEGIFCTFSRLFGDNTHAIALSPCYQSLRDLPKTFGAQVTDIALRFEDQWQPDLEAIRAAIRPDTQAIIVNSPHNPTGTMLSKENEQALINLCEEYGLTLFADEVYRLLGPKTTEWRAPIASQTGAGISLGVMSKSYGLAGLRVGWIASQNIELLHAIEQTKYYTSICNSVPSELLSCIALEARDTILARNGNIVDHNLSLLDSFMERHAERFSWVRPEGGCCGLVQDHGKENVETLADELLKATGVLIMPGSVYDLTSNTFRIGFGRKNMPEALEHFESFILKG